MASGKTKGNAEKVISDVLHCGRVIGATELAVVNSAGVPVGKDKLIRIRVAGATFVSFKATAATFVAPSATTERTLELPVAGTYLVSSHDEMLISSGAIARIEVL